MICVDNASSDGSPSAIRPHPPTVDAGREPSNLGFSGGNNVGIRAAFERGAEWVVLLNNDATLAPAAIAELDAVARARPSAGVLGGKVLFADPPDRIWFAGQRFRAALGYSGRPRGYRKPDGLEFARAARRPGRRRDAWRSRGAAIDAVGLLDEDLFAYVEDVDWSLRAREAGFEVLLVPRARAWHRVGASTGGERASSTAVYYGVRNMIVVCERHRPLPPGLRELRRLVIASTFAATVALGDARGPRLRAVVEGVQDARRGRLGLRGGA